MNTYITTPDGRRFLVASRTDGGSPSWSSRRRDAKLFRRAIDAYRVASQLARYGRFRMLACCAIPHMVHVARRAR